MLEKGDIIYRNNLVFADNGKLDLKIGGHPTLNITDDVNGFTYFFLITSSRISGSKETPRRYYKLEKDKANALNKRSWVDLSYVFKEETVNKIPSGYVGEKTFNDIIVSFLYALQEDNIEYDDEQLKNIEEVLELIDYNAVAKATKDNKRNILKLIQEKT